MKLLREHVKLLRAHVKSITCARKKVSIFFSPCPFRGSVIILPNTGLSLRQHGVLETVSLYAIIAVIADVPVVVQIWRPLSIQHPYEKYKLVHSIRMTSILGRMQHTSRNQPLEVQKFRKEIYWACISQNRTLYLT